MSLPKFFALSNVLTLGEFEAAMAKTKAVRTSPGEGIAMLYWEDRKFGMVKALDMRDVNPFNLDFLDLVKAVYTHDGQAYQAAFLGYIYKVRNFTYNKVFHPNAGCVTSPQNRPVDDAILYTSRLQ
jgi:hypothetical protein